MMVKYPEALEVIVDHLYFILLLLFDFFNFLSVILFKTDEFLCDRKRKISIWLVRIWLFCHLILICLQV